MSSNKSIKIIELDEDFEVLGQRVASLSERAIPKVVPPAMVVA